MSKTRLVVWIVAGILVLGLVVLVIFSLWPGQLGFFSQKAGENLYEKGLESINKGDYQAAAKYFQTAVNTDPENVNYLNQLAVTKYNLKDYPAAISLYEKVIEKDSQNAFAYNGLGNTYRDMGDTDKAKENYQKAIEANPQFVVAYNNYAQVLIDEDKKTEAIEILKDGLKANPESSELKTVLETIKD